MHISALKIRLTELFFYYLPLSFLQLQQSVDHLFGLRSHYSHQSNRWQFKLFSTDIARDSCKGAINKSSQMIIQIANKLTASARWATLYLDVEPKVNATIKLQIIAHYVGQSRTSSGCLQVELLIGSSTGRCIHVRYTQRCWMKRNRFWGWLMNHFVLNQSKCTWPHGSSTTAEETKYWFERCISNMKSILGQTKETLQPQWYPQNYIITFSFHLNTDAKCILWHCYFTHRFHHSLMLEK